MRNGLLLMVMAALAIAGCTPPDENPTWNAPEQYPPEFYDQPFYRAPAVELQPTEKVGNNIPIYYSRDELVFVKHPSGKQPYGSPRLAMFYSTNGGTVWNKAGYYGLEQTHFEFHAPEDGRYWLRFVGPGQGTADVPPGQPHRVYVVDTHAPKINMTVNPSPWLDEERKVPRQYRVGQEVVLHWTVDDKHLIKDSIQLATCYAQFPHNLVWSEFGDQMAPVGAVRVVIPPEAAHQAGLRFRIIAKDKAGNIGIALSEIMPVTDEPLPASERPQIADLGPARQQPVPQTPQPLEQLQPAPEPQPQAKPVAAQPAPQPQPVTPQPAAKPQPQETAATPAPQPVKTTPAEPNVVTKKTAAPEPVAPVARKTAPAPSAPKPVVATKSKPVAQKPAPAAAPQQPKPVSKTLPKSVTQRTPLPETKRSVTLKADSQADPMAEDMADLERRMAELKKQREAEKAREAAKAARQAQLSPTDPAEAAARPSVNRTDELSGVQRTTRRPTINTTPAPLTDPIQIRPADQAADVAPPSDLLERVVVEDTPKQPQPSRRQDVTPAVSSAQLARRSQPDTPTAPATPVQPKKATDQPTDAQAAIARLRMEIAERDQQETDATLKPARPTTATSRHDAVPDIATDTPQPAPQVAAKLSPRTATTTTRRDDEGPAIATDTPDDAGPVTAELTPQKDIPETTRRDAEASLDRGESMAEIEARMARLAAERRQQTQAQPAQPKVADRPRDIQPPVADVEEIADAVVELPTPTTIAPPRDETRRDARPAVANAEDIADRVVELEPARPVQPAVAATPEPADIAMADMDVNVDEIEQQLAELKRQRDAERALTAKSAQPKVAATNNTKIDETTVVEIDRQPRQRLTEPTQPAAPDATIVAGEEAEVNRLLKPIDVDRAIRQREALASQTVEPLTVAAASRRTDETPGPALRTDRRGPAEDVDDDAVVDPAPIKLVELPRPKAPAAAKAAGSAKVADLRAVPESVQQGWPAEGMTLRGGVNRLLNWLPDGTGNYTFVELQFSSDSGHKWLTVANGLRNGRAAMWHVPKISSDACRLRIIGRDGKGGEEVLAVSDPFRVDSGLWETVDLSGK